MEEPKLEQFGITQEQFKSIISKKEKFRNYTFGISSAVGILTGIIYGLSISQGIYNTILFFLFFGCFLGSLAGAIFTIISVRLFTLLLYIFSPVYRNSRHYLNSRSKERLESFTE
jgi:hypothetical protein